MSRVGTSCSGSWTDYMAVKGRKSRADRTLLGIDVALRWDRSDDRARTSVPAQMEVLLQTGPAFAQRRQISRLGPLSSPTTGILTAVAMTIDTPSSVPSAPRSRFSAPDGPSRNISADDRLLGGVLYLALVVAIVVLAAPERSLQWWAAFIEIASNLLVSVAGAAVALWWFFRRDTTRPRINITHEVELIGDDEKLQRKVLAVTAHFHNVGGVPVYIDRWTLSVFQLGPCPDALRVALNKEGGWVCVDQQVEWKSSLAARELEEHHILGSWVRSGEIQSMLGFAAIERDTSIVKVKTDIPHRALRLFGSSVDRAWSTVTVKRLEEST